MIAILSLLKGFAKTDLLPVGVSQTFQFSLIADDLSFYGLNNERRTEDGTFTITVPNSNPNIPALTASITLAVGNPSPAPSQCGGDACVIRTPTPLILSVVGAFVVGAVSVIIFVRCMSRPTSAGNTQYNAMTR